MLSSTCYTILTTRHAKRWESNDLVRFTRMVANTRNSLTHLTPQDGPVASTAREYYEMNQRLRALLYGRLAQELGFAGRALQDCVLRVRAYT